MMTVAVKIGQTDSQITRTKKPHKAVDLKADQRSDLSRPSPIRHPEGT